MPLARVYVNGLTLGMGGNPNPVGGKRGEVVGWTQNAVRRHTTWLYSIDAAGLTGQGWALTLTLRDTPATSADWARLRKNYLDALRRSGLDVLRVHWVVEWQRRGTPHLHMAVYTREGFELQQVRQELVGEWVRQASPWRAHPNAQYVLPISGAVGWLEYLSKHAARGVQHYQRNGKPAGWETTGRLWGKQGEWPAVEAAEAYIDRAALFRFRRLARAWRIADAREAARSGVHGAPRRIGRARRMLKCNDRTLSEVRGVSEWIPSDVGMVLLDLAAAEARGSAAPAAA